MELDRTDFKNKNKSNIRIASNYSGILVSIGILLAGFLISSCALSKNERNGSENQISISNQNSAELLEVMKDFQLGLDSVKMAIDSNELTRIHDLSQKLVHGRKAIVGLYRTEESWKAKKVKRISHDIDISIHFLHEYADSRDPVGASTCLQALNTEYGKIKEYVVPNQIKN